MNAITIDFSVCESKKIVSSVLTFSIISSIPLIAFAYFVFMHSKEAFLGGYTDSWLNDGSLTSSQTSVR